MELLFILSFLHTSVIILSIFAIEYIYPSWNYMYDRKQNLSIGLQTNIINQCFIFLACIKIHIYIWFFSCSLDGLETRSYLARPEKSKVSVPSLPCLAYSPSKIVCVCLILSCSIVTKSVLFEVNVLVSAYTLEIYIES
jgi:hypothetical protein